MKSIIAETMLEFQFPCKVAFSPNGKKIAYILHQMNEEKNGYTGNLFITSPDSPHPKQLTFAGDVKSFIWEDDENILFPALRDAKLKKKKEQGEELTAYYRLPLTGGEAQLAFTLPITATALNPLKDGGFLVTATFDHCRPDTTGLSAVETEKAMAHYKKPAYAEFTELPFWSDGNGLVNGKRNRLYRYQPQTKILTPITEPLFQLNGISYNDQHLLYRGSSYSTVKGIKDGLFLYHFQSGTHSTLIPQDEMKVSSSVILEDNSIIACLSDMVPYGVNQFPHFYRIDPKTGERTLLLENDASVGGSSVNSDAKYGGGQSYMAVGNRFYFLTTLGDYSYLRYIDATGYLSDCLTPDGSIDCFDLHQDNWAGVMMTAQNLPEVYYNGKALSHHNRHMTKDYHVIQPEKVTVPCRDGYEISGYLMKPVGYEVGKKYPAILNIHGGPRSVYSDVFLHEMQVWANAGYFVFYSNPIGSDGRGNLFGDINGHYGDTDYQQLMDFTDYMLAYCSDIDVERLGITGGSYGGFMTNWVIGHTHRFKAAATQRSISNFITYEGVSDIGYYFTEDMLSATVHTDLESVWNQSPLKYGMNVKTPTLFIQSKEDYRCWYGDSIQFFNLLKRNGVDSKYLLFYDESHGLSRIGKPSNRIKRINAITQWFDLYLK